MKVNISTFELSDKCCFCWDSCRLAEEVYQRACADAQTLEEAFAEIPEALDNALIPCANQWLIMKEYQIPEEADYYAAYDAFLYDLEMYFNSCVTVEEE